MKALPVSYFPGVLKCRRLDVACVPDRSKTRAKDVLRICGAITLSLYGPEKTDWLNRRHAGVTEPGRWMGVSSGGCNSEIRKNGEVSQTKSGRRFHARDARILVRSSGYSTLGRGLLRWNMPCIAPEESHAAGNRLCPWLKHGPTSMCLRVLASTIKNEQSTIPSLRLLGDVQQHAHTGQRHEQRRSAVGNERERYTLCRHHAEDDAYVDQCLEHDHAGDPNG